MSLAIECGATKSVVVIHDGGNGQNQDDQDGDDQRQQHRIKRYHFGPANFKLLKRPDLERFFANIQQTVAEKNITALAVAMPGVLNNDDRKALQNVVQKIWPKLTRIWIGNDSESALARLPSSRMYTIRCVAISGTGSCCYGVEHHTGRTCKIGGQGHVIGDRGSGYSIAHRALRLAVREYEYALVDDKDDHDDDHHNRARGDAYNRLGDDNGNNNNGGPSGSGTTRANLEHDPQSTVQHTSLLKLFLSHLNMITIYELINWSLVASKQEIADLARLVARAAKYGNPLAVKVIDEATTEMADDIRYLIRALKRQQPGNNETKKNFDDSDVCVGFTGRMFTTNISFTNATIRKLRDAGCRAHIVTLTDTVLGALQMVLDDGNDEQPSLSSQSLHQQQQPTLSKSKSIVDDDNTDNGQSLAERILPHCTGLPETEKRNPRSMNLDTMPLVDAIELMIDEESRGIACLRKHIPAISTLVMKITNAFRCGGRLIYVGAGTSGRLGILDSSECPPTFKTPPHWVQGIIAGGPKAIQTSIEGAEDCVEDGIASIIDKDVCDKDVVLGIAACGRTPFVWGGLYESSVRRHAYTALLTFNPHIQPKFSLDQLLAINTGAEVLTGSTRLKAGTATKCVLNMLTTLSMVQYGKCLENLMVDLMPVNAKLRDRALRITLMILTNKCDDDEEEEEDEDDDDDSDGGDDDNETDFDIEEVHYLLQCNGYDIKKTVTEIREKYPQLVIKSL